jgi:hypothetical protein
LTSGLKTLAGNGLDVFNLGRLVKNIAQLCIRALLPGFFDGLANDLLLNIDRDDRGTCHVWKNEHTANKQHADQ